jgi:hypothetical protein
VKSCDLPFRVVLVFYSADMLLLYTLNIPEKAIMEANR